MATARSSPLPVQLRYLEPVRRQLAKFGDEHVWENTDLSLLRKVVRERVKGLSSEEARAALKGDGVELERWLSAPERQTEAQDVALSFVLPFLAMDDAEVLLADVPKRMPKREVRMELPKGAKLVSNENGCWSVKWQGMLLTLLHASSESVQREVARFQREAQNSPLCDDEGVAVADVRFGKASGTKRIYKQKWPAPGQRLDYALAVPGGHVRAQLTPRTDSFDDRNVSTIEASFQTLQVIHNTSVE